ncbi:MAG: hypothetical protein ACRDHL_03930 [Candidatus Promineifilaceae bacterium]
MPNTGASPLGMVATALGLLALLLVARRLRAA